MQGKKRYPTQAEFLNELFEYEYCAECGGDKRHHTVACIMGNWFAKCKYPYDTDKDQQHPVIQAFRKREEL